MSRGESHDLGGKRIDSGIKQSWFESQDSCFPPMFWKEGQRTRDKAVEGKGSTMVGPVSSAETFGIRFGGRGKALNGFKKENGIVHSLGGGTWVQGGQMEGRQAKRGLRDCPSSHPVYIGRAAFT